MQKQVRTINCSANIEAGVVSISYYSLLKVVIRRARGAYVLHIRHEYCAFDLMCAHVCVRIQALPFTCMRDTLADDFRGPDIHMHAVISSINNSC